MEAGNACQSGLAALMACIPWNGSQELKGGEGGRSLPVLLNFVRMLRNYLRALNPPCLKGPLFLSFMMTIENVLESQMCLGWLMKR